MVGLTPRSAIFVKDRYPENWKDLAAAVKEGTGWKCQKCSLQCLRPGEDAFSLVKTCEQFGQIPVKRG